MDEKSKLPDSIAADKGAGKCPFYEPRFPEDMRDVDSKNLSGISDLVIFAPIKEGFIDAFGNITFESRLKIVAEALHKLRKNVREFQLIEPFADPTKRILSLLDFRIGIVDRDLYGFGRESEADGKVARPRKFMFLTATFDGAWEPYMRLIWKPLGDFLDLVLCNCDGYVPSTRGYEEYIEWVRGHLLDTAIFYAVSDLTVKDGLYLSGVERIHRETGGTSVSDETIATLTTRDPDDEAKQVRKNNPGESLKLGMEGLNVLYQLTRYYPPDLDRDGDGLFLHNATHAFLEKFQFMGTLQAMVRAGGHTKKIADEMLVAYRDPLAWYDTKYPDPIIARSIDPALDTENVQKGLLSSYDFDDDDPVTNGAVALLRITDPKRAAAFMHPMFWSWEGDTSWLYSNIALTMGGLEKMGLTEAELKSLPKEFRQGMEERATLLGDVHYNHPQRWALPKRNMLLANLPTHDVPSVAMSEVDLVVQLRSINFWRSLGATESSGSTETTVSETFIAFEDSDWGPADTKLNEGLQDFDFENGDPFSLLETFFQKNWNTAAAGNPYELLRRVGQDGEAGADGNTPIHLILRLLQLHGPFLGVELLSVQSSFRPGVTDGSSANMPVSETAEPDTKAFSPGSNITRDHFGFRDGISQPVINPNIVYPAKKGDDRPMDVKRGDILLGHSTMLGDYATQNENKKIFTDGSFLAIRRMRQNVGEFERFLEANKQALGREGLAAKLMGRTFDGEPLIKPLPPEPNNFLYEKDKDGTQCPFISHIRRTNPRDVQHHRKAPKILRRGMSYGPPVSSQEREKSTPEAIDSVDRGVLFMAYCSSLSEQFETIQRWVNGANSHHVGSAQSDPIFSPLPRDGRSVARFADESASGNLVVHRVERRTESIVLPPKAGKDVPPIAPRPFVQLEWGLYAFVPSRDTLNEIIARIVGGTARQGPIFDRVEQGRKTVAEIENLPSDALKRREWKVLLEDHLVKDPAEQDISPMVWDYLRRAHKGVYRIESGIEGRDEAESEQKVLLVLEKDRINEVLSDSETFSSEEIGQRLGNVFAPHHVGMDPGDRYWNESSATNEIFFDYKQEAAFDEAFRIGKSILDTRKCTEQTIYNPIPGSPKKFKIELTRDYIAPVLAEISKAWFGLPDETHFEAGAWAWDMTLGADRKTRCPGDFLAPSRGSFYPRPTAAIEDYAQQHGRRLRQSIEGLIASWRETAVEGYLSKKLDAVIPTDDLLGRNIIGSMIGMLPPMDATLRVVLRDWVDEKTLWKLQGRLNALAAREGLAPESYAIASDVIEEELMRSMGKRPAPDLLYRTAKKSGTLGETSYEAGDLVILSLVSATQADNQRGNPDVDIVFGGRRKEGARNPPGNPHACPAQKMVMGSITGFLTALLTAGRIQAMPASLILEFSDWSPVKCDSAGKPIP